MKKILFVLFLILSSCVNSSIHNKNVFFRGTFLKIEKKVTISACNPANPKQCLKKTYQSSASSFLIRNNGNKSYLLTAAHVCHTDYGRLHLLPNFQVKEDFYGINHEMKKFNYKVHKLDLKNDLCLVVSERIGSRPYRIAVRTPSLGRLIYNIAAPMGIYEKGVVPLFKGFYSGESYEKSVYSLPAAGGSSGSPILNNDGEVIGVVSAVTREFNQIVISPTLKQIRRFVYSEKL
jgi:S1-C subfamily serine protease